MSKVQRYLNLDELMPTALNDTEKRHS
nr:hypothetical protein [Bittarella massiliensis (ex Durand et al. 2017)]